MFCAVPRRTSVRRTVLDAASSTDSPCSCANRRSRAKSSSLAAYFCANSSRERTFPSRSASTSGVFRRTSTDTCRILRGGIRPISLASRGALRPLLGNAIRLGDGAIKSPRTRSPSILGRLGGLPGCCASHPESPAYSGMLPCFFGGFLSRLPSKISSAWIKRLRVSCGRITASTYPRSAAV